MRLSVAALAVALLAPTAAQAGFPIKEKVRCAVGGERFTYVTTPSYTIFGARPDGKPYGSWTFPLALPICPGNGLIMYKEFSKAEVQALPRLLASPDYKALKEETPRYRAAWLARSLDPQDLLISWLLLEASWEADHEPARRSRYLSEFAKLALETAPREELRPAFVLRLRTANALRELGRFDEATALLKEIGAPPPPQDENAPDQITRDRAFLEDAVRGLARAIERKDTSAEPLDLLPPRIAASLCLGDDDVGFTPGDEIRPRSDPYCESAEFRAQLEKMRAEEGPLVDSAPDVKP